MDRKLNGSHKQCQSLRSKLHFVNCRGSPYYLPQFGEEFRPCKLVRHIVTIPRHQNQNDFQFINSLNYKVFPVIQQYTEGKPTLVFCATRNGTLAAAECTRKAYVALEEKRAKVPWNRPPRSFGCSPAFLIYSYRINRGNASFHEKRLEGTYRSTLNWRTQSQALQTSMPLELVFTTQVFRPKTVEPLKNILPRKGYKYYLQHQSVKFRFAIVFLETDYVDACRRGQSPWVFHGLFACR